MPKTEYMLSMARTSAFTNVSTRSWEPTAARSWTRWCWGEASRGARRRAVPHRQPQVSKHLRVLSEVGHVKCRAEGRGRLYRVDHEHLRPLHDWLEKYEQYGNGRLDRLDDYLSDLE
jgi:hypothetical protein